MKKLMLTCLIAIPFCQAADHDQMFGLRETPLNLNIQKGMNFNERIDLSGKQLAALPNDFNDFTYPMLISLDLSENEISDEVINQIIGRFKDLNEHYLPNLRALNLSENPITQDVLEELKRVVKDRGRRIKIIAEDITGDDRTNIKG